jgi:hypothetical protein
MRSNLDTRRRNPIGEPGGRKISDGQRAFLRDRGIAVPATAWVDSNGWIVETLASWPNHRLKGAAGLGRIRVPGIDPLALRAAADAWLAGDRPDEDGDGDGLRKQ